jgi:hypothetical protein
MAIYPYPAGLAGRYRPQFAPKKTTPRITQGFDHPVFLWHAIFSRVQWYAIISI